MDFAEEKIAENYSQILLHSSLAAKAMYLKRGYKEKRTCKIEAGNGDILVYDEMGKPIACQQGKINYNGRHFVPKSNTENGEVDEKTIFHYFQDKDTFWAEYSGGDVEKGKIELHEKWQWLNGDMSCGESVIVER